MNIIKRGLNRRRVFIKYSLNRRAFHRGGQAYEVAVICQYKLHIDASINRHKAFVPPCSTACLSASPQSDALPEGVRGRCQKSRDATALGTLAPLRHGYLFSCNGAAKIYTCPSGAKQGQSIARSKTEAKQEQCRSEAASAAQWATPRLGMQ